MSIGGMNRGKPEVPDLDASDDGARQTIPLMGGVVRPDMPEATDLDFNEAPKPGIHISQTTGLFLVLLLIAVTAIYLMRWSQNKPPTTIPPDVQTRIEDALAKFQSNAMDPKDPLAQNNVNGFFSEVDSVVHIFDTDPAAHQVPLEYVQKNPFVSPIVRAADKSAPAIGYDSTFRKLDAEFKTLVLKSIARGRVPLALIGDQMVQPGQKIGSFMVLSITGMTVELSAEGYTFKLTMDDKIKERGH